MEKKSGKKDKNKNQKQKKTIKALLILSKIERSKRMLHQKLNSYCQRPYWKLTKLLLKQT